MADPIKLSFLQSLDGWKGGGTILGMEGRRGTILGVEGRAGGLLL